MGGSIEEEVVIEGANSSSSSGLVDEQCRVCGEDDDTGIKNDDETPAPTSIVKDPGAPTSEEKEAHNATHLPYRSWCPVCVKAKGKEDPQYSKGEKGVHAKPTVSID